MIAWLLTLFLSVSYVPMGAEAPALPHGARTTLSSVPPQGSRASVTHPRAHVYLNTLLGLFQATPTRNRIPAPVLSSILTRRELIENVAHTSQESLGVPMGVILVVGFSETHLGSDAHEGGNWGAPIDAAHRHTAGAPIQAARVLARSYQVCGNDWQRAVARFRSGLCVPHNPVHQRYVANVTSLVRRMYVRTGDPLPGGFERDVRIRASR